MVAAAWLRGGQVLAARHPDGTARAGTWEFPGGKVESGERDVDALRRELEEELGVTVASIGAVIGRCTFEASGRTIDLWLYEVDDDEAEPQALEHAALAWVDAATGDGLAWSEADATLWSAVRCRLSQ